MFLQTLIPSEKMKKTDSDTSEKSIGVNKRKIGINEKIAKETNPRVFAHEKVTFSKVSAVHQKSFRMRK